MVVVTQVFANLARTAARARGIEDLRTLVLPHPMEARPGEEIERIALEGMEIIRELLTLPRGG